MGWREFQAYLKQMHDDLTPQAPDPGSWKGADSDPAWQEMRAKRDAMNRGAEF